MQRTARTRASFASWVMAALYVTERVHPALTSTAILVSPCVENDDTLAARDLAAVAQHLQGDECGSRLRPGVDPLTTPDFRCGRFDRGLVDGNGASLRVADRPEHQEISDRTRDAQPPRARVWRLPFRRFLESLLIRANHWRAAGRLHAEHPWPLAADPAEALHLVERLPHADEARAAAGRVEDDVGQ